MQKDWITGEDGTNLRFKREALLNYGMNRWGLNKASSVDPTSEDSVSAGGKKKNICNTEVVDQIREEIARLQQ